MNIFDDSFIWKYQKTLHAAGERLHTGGHQVLMTVSTEIVSIRNCAVVNLNIIVCFAMPYSTERKAKTKVSLWVDKIWALASQAKKYSVLIRYLPSNQTTPFSTRLFHILFAQHISQWYPMLGLYSSLISDFCPPEGAWLVGNGKQVSLICWPSWNL